MDYIKWNEALKNYYFNSGNFYKEVILYADIETINLIGAENNLGNYDDFLKSVLVDFESKIEIFDKINKGIKRDIPLTRTIKKSLIEFPMLLMDTKSKYDIIYLNYIIFYITIYINNTDDSFYRNLNAAILNFLPNERKINTLKNLNVLFDELEKWSISKNKGIFKAYRIGRLAYKGLLHYQVVLSPPENAQFEEFLYKNQIQIDDNTLFYELANKILPVLESGKLRSKFLEATSNELYAEWFLNKVKNFDLQTHKNNLNGDAIEFHRRGLLTFYIDIENIKLLLKSDTTLYETDEPINFSIPISGKDNFGNNIHPIIVENHKEIKFNEYCLSTKGGSLELRTQKIKEINFFEKSYNYYIQTIAPRPNTEVLIVVKNEKNNLERWQKWSSVTSFIEKCEIIKSNNNLLNLFGDNYTFYNAFNIKKSFYKNDENAIFETNYNNQLLIKKLGGLKIDKHLYLSISLPYFELQNSSVDSNDLIVKLFLNGQICDNYTQNIIDNKFYFFLNDNLVLNDISLITIKFIVNDIEKRFDFSITKTEFIIPDPESLFKFNQWGMNNSSETTYLQGGKIIGSNQSELNNNTHPIKKLVEDSSYDDNFFLFNLTGISSKKENQIIKRIDINNAIDATLIYLESKGYKINEHQYSRSNLINNLIGLGYFTRKVVDQKEYFQLLPPELHQIEKSLSYDYPNQAYQLKGFKTKMMLEKLMDFCQIANINVRFKRYNICENNDLEKALLPELIYLNFNNNMEQFKAFLLTEFNIDIPVISRYHFGDSLLNFINSIQSFESSHLTEPLNLENHKLINSQESIPRIVESESKTFINGQLQNLFFLENEKRKYYKLNPINYKWAKIYTAFKRKETLLLMNKIFGDRGTINYNPKILIPSKYKLPEIIYRAFCTINHGIPKTNKYFILNSDNFLNSEDKNFNYFDSFNISEKVERKENIARILTGTVDFNNNKQINYYYKGSDSITMEFIKCSIFSDLKWIILIKSKKLDKIIAIQTNFKQIFLNIEVINLANPIVSKEFLIDEEVLNMIEIQYDKTKINKTISKIIENQFTNQQFSTPSKSLKIETKKETKEEIALIKIEKL
ncbi:MAG: hypothetical protein GZ086_00965 [Gelidibacter sp.]|nr:hypothetical protein [Gelidibacter sp.]